MNFYRMEVKVGGTLNTGVMNMTSMNAEERVSSLVIGNREVEGALISAG